MRCDEENGVIEAKSYDGGDGGSNSDSVFEVLQTRWQISPSQGENAGQGSEGRVGGDSIQTSVRLDIDVKFRNIVYDQMFAQVEGKVASTMIGAFEKRVQELEGRQ